MDNTLLKYRALLEAERLGSFTKAGEMLGYTQSGVSRIIAELERDWGVKLLERSRGGVRFTSEGQQLAPYIKRVCEEHDRLQAHIDAMSGLDSGLIRIASITSVAAHWLPSIIERFRDDYPNIDYEITTGSYSVVERLIAEGHADCGFLRLPTRHRFDTIFLERDEMKVIMAPDHPMTAFDRFPIRALGDYPFMNIDKEGDSDITDVLERYGITLQCHLTTWDDYAVFGMVEKGLGISVLPALILRHLPFNVEVRGFDEPVYREIALALRHRASAPLATQRFIEYLDYRN